MYYIGIPYVIDSYSHTTTVQGYIDMYIFVILYLFVNASIIKLF